MKTQTRPFNCFDAGGAVLFALQKKAVDPAADLQLTTAIEQRIRNRERVDSSVRVAKGPAPVINQPTTESAPSPPSTPTPAPAPTAAPSVPRRGPSLATVLIGYPVMVLTMVVVFGIPLFAVSSVITSAIQRSRALAPAAVKPMPPAQAPATSAPVISTSTPAAVPPVPAPAPAPAVATVEATPDPEPPVLPPPTTQRPIVVPPVPAFPPPPTAAELRALHPMPGQIAEQESIDRLEALGVICSPARSRFLTQR